MSTQLSTGPFVLVIFGATGDLARNQLFPALYSLFQKNLLGEKFYIVGFARRDFTDEAYKKFVADALHIDAPNANLSWEAFSKNIYYQQGLFDDPKGYEELIPRLNTFDQEIGACITRLFYLATPPDHYESILKYLHETKLSEGCGQGSDKWTKVAIEKPFGKDLTHAMALDKKLSEIFEERQIYRVDHYLGKETVQNILAFRFANGIFEPVWSNKYIDHVQITFAESQGIEGRGQFFDGVGILRDVAQNHLMQLVASVAMEQPASFTKESVRDARAAAIKAIAPIHPTEVNKYVVRGQYEGYTDEPDVAKDSTTETFVAMKFFMNTPRFSGVPFYIRAGKKLPKGVVEIKIVFIQTCHILFKEYGCPEIGNVLTIRIQPDEGIGIRVIAKQPGSKLSLATVDIKFTYKDEFGSSGDDAYDRVLQDILAGDQMLFNRSDELESSWHFIEHILNGWKHEQQQPNWKIPVYQPDSEGPKEAQDLIEKDMKKWL